MLRRAVTICAVTLILGGVAAAQEAVELTYGPEFEKGAVFQSDIEIKSDQTLTIADMPLETHADSFMTLKETVAGTSSEGGWTFQGEFSLIQSEMELPGGLKLSFNSNNPDQADEAGPLSIIVDALKATAGAKWTAETNDKHELVKMEYEGDPFADVDPTVKGQEDPENIKKARSIELKRYPDKPVKPGDSWTRIEEMNIGGGQTLTLEKEFTYTGAEDRDGKTFDKVTVKALSVEYAMADDAPSPAKITDSELEVASSKGTYYYDRDAKFFTDAGETVQVKGTLTLDIAGQQLPGELDLTMSTGAKSTIIAP